MAADLETLSETLCFGGVQGVYRHRSSATGTEMTFALYRPPPCAGRAPAVLYLSGLTCTHDNVTVKAGAQRYCAEHGIALIAPDTSPRGLDLPGEHEAYDFGSGAGFYVDATRSPWSAHYRMETYVVEELPALIAGRFDDIDMGRLGVTGHSMGGHGALTLGLRHPDRFRSVSAFAPIVAPSAVPWGRKAFSGYLGDDERLWRAHDACCLIEDGARAPALLVDQGLDDAFLDEQLQPERLEAACAKAGLPLTLRRHAGYDHSYFFVASFIGDHVAWAAARL